MDLTNAFWSLRLHDHLNGTFKVEVEGDVFGFDCLPFGWQFSPLICQTMPAYYLETLGLSNMLVILQYLDNFGATRVRSSSAALCELLRSQGLKGPF